MAGGSPQHSQVECSHIRGCVLRTRLRLVKSTAGRALHCTFLQCLDCGLDFSLNAVRPLCFSSNGIYFIPVLNQERGTVCWWDDKLSPFYQAATPHLSWNQTLVLSTIFSRDKKCQFGQERPSFQSHSFSPLPLKKKKKIRLTVVSSCTPGFQGSHFKSLSGYSLSRETETQEIEYFIHLSLGVWQSKEWILALQSHASILTYHRDPVRLMVVVVSELHQCLPCWKELMVLHLSFSTCSEIPLTPHHSHDLLQSLKLNKTGNNKATKGQCNLEVIPIHGEYKVCVFITLLIW